MASLPSSKIVTYEEWLRMPEVTDAIEEVVNGEIQIMPPAKRYHARIIQKLNRILENTTDRSLVEVYGSSGAIVIRKSPLTTRIPDVAVFLSSSIVEKDGYIHSAPQFAVEVLSPGNTARRIREKLADYASIGAPEVWVFLPESRSVEVYQLEDRELRCQRTLKEGILTPRHFPTVRIDIATVWPA